MRVGKMSLTLLISLLSWQCMIESRAVGNDGYGLWLSCSFPDQSLLSEYQDKITSVVVIGNSRTCEIIRDELNAGLTSLLGKIEIMPESGLNECDLIIGPASAVTNLNELISPELPVDLGPEGFMISSLRIGEKESILISANTEIGCLYGSFHFLRLLQVGQSLTQIHLVSRPRIQYRLLNHWDNLNGRVERGYAGRSLWKWEELPDSIDSRYRDYARANASIGINGAVLNNVNADPRILRADYLRKVAALADAFRPYGIRVFLSVNFSSPISAEFEVNRNRHGGIGTLSESDPLNPEVRKWWKEKAVEIYKLIPDFGGFLVKANSEGMPGPLDYGRSHADGANMLAEALAPYGGVVMWRSFVYNADVDPDRAKRAYLDFVPLDGRFAKNVFVQSKNGPVDFQPREPVAPIFGGMPYTPLILELQITQEYLGHSTHLVYLGSMWKEYLEFDTFARGEGSTLASVIDGTLHHSPMTGIAGVTNIGDNRNWTGHFFAQANWYTFGRLAWDHALSAEQIAGEWIRQSLGQDPVMVEKVTSMMMGSWEACVNYMTPLGLHHIMQEGFHYGPQPSLERAPRKDWTSVYYHRADSLGLGFNRSSNGSDAVGQYFSPLSEQFDSLRICPEKYLLWFHHVPWDYTMKSGRTLWQSLCDHYYSGTDYVNGMIETWAELKNKIDPEVYQHVSEKLKQQQKDASIWRDTCLNYFQEFSRMKIVNVQTE
jgi:alpha-glucuronidase